MQLESCKLTNQFDILFLSVIKSHVQTQTRKIKLLSYVCVSQPALNTHIHTAEHQFELRHCQVFLKIYIQSEIRNSEK